MRLIPAVRCWLEIVVKKSVCQSLAYHPMEMIRGEGSGADEAQQNENSVADSLQPCARLPIFALSTDGKIGGEGVGAGEAQQKVPVTDSA